MARMIPPFPVGKAPLGEKFLFAKFKDDPSTKDWIVFHSLKVMEHEYKEEGEVDFVVVVPFVGVLFIEVKGCPISFVDGVWTYHYESGDKISKEGPFRQVSSAMRSLRGYIQKHDNSLSKLLCFSAVFFTQVDFKVETSEWHKWQAIDRSLLFKDSISDVVLNILERAHKHISMSSNSRAWYNKNHSRPSALNVERLTKLLRPKFEFFESKVSRSAETLSEICRFTAEQIDLLDCVFDNDHLVVSGPAGTGKTVVAVEFFKRMVNQGYKVALVCFNRHLGEWLKKGSLSELNVGNSFVGTFDSLLCSIAGGSYSAEGSYNRNLVLSRFDDLYAADKVIGDFDFFVIDEAQDLLRKEFLEVFDVLLRNGLSGGKWLILGDFERQAIYTLDSSVEDKLAILRDKSNFFAKASLRVNCRNGPDISETLSMLCGLKPTYKSILKDSLVSKVEPIFYRSEFAFYDQISSRLESLLKVYKPREIVILSTRRIEDSSISLINDESLPCKLVPYALETKEREIRFSTIQAFKGLEAPVVLLIDIEGLTSDYHQALLYVGMSRAQVELQIFMREELLVSYNALLSQGLAQLSGEN